MEVHAHKIKSKSIATVTAALILIALFAVILFFLLSSVGEVDGGIVISKNSPERLVSAGAPRSQLALKQMFDSMSAVNTNGNLTVYEPITEEYLASVKERIERGEAPRLSVEEVLYVISDSISLSEKYDGIKLHGLGTVNTKKNEKTRPAHILALETCRDVTQIILYRIQSLCAPETIESDGNVIRYYPDADKKGEGARMFVFTNVSDDMSSDNIVFCPGNGEYVSLYPSAELSAKCDLKYTEQSAFEFTEAEQVILTRFGYETEYCRNITPEYWMTKSDCRLAVSAGRVIVIDAKEGIAVDIAPENMRVSSVALADADGDGIRELYFTAYDSIHGAAALRFIPGASEYEFLFEHMGGYLGVYETLDGNGVAFYRAERLSNGEYLTLLSKKGSAIRIYSTEA